MLTTLFSPIKQIYNLTPANIFFSSNKPPSFSPPPTASTNTQSKNHTHPTTASRSRGTRSLRKESSVTLHAKKADARKAYVKHQHQQKKRVIRTESTILPLPGAWPGTFYQPPPLPSESAPASGGTAADSTSQPRPPPPNLAHTNPSPTDIPALLTDAETFLNSTTETPQSDKILLEQLKILQRKKEWQKELENARTKADRGVESAMAEKKMREELERSGKAKKWDGRLMSWEERRRRCEARKALAKEQERMQHGHSFWKFRNGMGLGGSGKMRKSNSQTSGSGIGKKGAKANANVGAKATYRGKHEYVPPRPAQLRPQPRPQCPPPQSQPPPPPPPQIRHGQIPQTTTQFTEALKKMVDEAIKARARPAGTEEARRRVDEARAAKEKADRDARQRVEQAERMRAQERERQTREAAERRERQQREAEERRRKEQKQQRGERQRQQQTSAAPRTTTSELLQLFEAYEAKWSILKSTPPPSQEGCPSDQQVAFHELPWPLLFSPSSLADFSLSNIKAFIFHPQRPGIGGKNRKDIVRAEMRRWHPDKFELSVGRRVVFPKNTEGGQEAVREVSKAIAGALNDLLCMDA